MNPPEASPLECCPTCGRRISDADYFAVELESGQRFCREHAPMVGAVAWLLDVRRYGLAEANRRADERDRLRGYRS